MKQIALIVSPKFKWMVIHIFGGGAAGGGGAADAVCVRELGANFCAHNKISSENYIILMNSRISEFVE